MAGRPSQAQDLFDNPASRIRYEAYSRLQAAAVAFGENLPIPEIVAIGGQSDGKSSLLEAFLGVSVGCRARGWLGVGWRQHVSECLHRVASQFSRLSNVPSLLMSARRRACCAVHHSSHLPNLHACIAPSSCTHVTRCRRCSPGPCPCSSASTSHPRRWAHGAR